MENIQTEVAALIDSRVTNKQLNPKEVASTCESVMGAKNIIAQNIGRTIISLELYKELRNKNKEVRVIILYDAETAKEVTKQAIREDLEKKAYSLVDQLAHILGL